MDKEKVLIEIAQRSNRVNMIAMIIVATFSLATLGLSVYSRHVTNQKINTMAELMDENFDIQNGNIQDFIDYVSKQGR